MIFLILQCKDDNKLIDCQLLNFFFRILNETTNGLSSINLSVQSLIKFENSYLYYSLKNY